MAKYPGRGCVEWFLLISMVVTFISIRSAEAVMVNATDTNLDYAFVFDESATMKQGDFNSTMKHLSQWVESIYDTKSDIDTQFAVLGCRQNKSYETPITTYEPMIVSQYLKDSTNKEETKEKIEDIRTRDEMLGDHRQDCFKKTFDDIFTEAKGDRPDSTNVLFYISDCSFMDNKNETPFEIETKNNMRKNKYAFIICITTASDAGVNEERWNETKSDINNMTWYEAALDLVNNDTKRLIIYKNFDQLLNETFELLPQKEVEAIPCKYTTKFSTDGCAFNKKTETCEDVVMYIILSPPVPMLPVPPGNECPTDSRVQCDKSSCSCSNIPMVFGECSVTCGNGTEMGRRNITLANKSQYFESRSADPKCDEDETRPCAKNPCETSAFLESTVAAAVELNTESVDSSQTTIIAVVCSILGLLLLIIIVIIVIITSRKKAKKAVVTKKTGKSVDDGKSAKKDARGKMVEEGLSDEAKTEKLKGIAADLSVFGNSTMLKAGKSMSIAAKGDRSKLAKADKSMAAKGDKSVAKKAVKDSKSVVAKGAKSAKK